jgi:hypothetical protein
VADRVVQQVIPEVERAEARIVAHVKAELDRRFHQQERDSNKARIQADVARSR